MGVGKHYVSQHALDRLRTRWPDASSRDDRTLIEFAATAIENAERAKTTLRTPSGTYVPFSMDGKDGYFVVRRDRVVTAVGAEYCPEVNALVEERQ